MPLPWTILVDLIFNSLPDSEDYCRSLASGAPSSGRRAAQYPEQSATKVMTHGSESDSVSAWNSGRRIHLPWSGTDARCDGALRVVSGDSIDRCISTRSFR